MHFYFYFSYNNLFFHSIQIFQEYCVITKYIFVFLSIYILFFLNQYHVLTYSEIIIFLILTYYIYY